jgi:endogenous inhibitor of DNA gyrase (YacG/DUF329 family)
MGDQPPSDPGQEDKDQRTCPICGKPASAKYKPFCSARCADVDLHRWLAGVYSVPVRDGDGDDVEPPRSETEPNKP